MSDIKGPSVDPATFRVEGHCCAIRLPGLATLEGGGTLYELTPEARAQLVKDGVLPAGAAPAAADAGPVGPQGEEPARGC